jgi:predicted P-loop ATPase
MADNNGDSQLPADLEFQVDNNGKVKQTIGNCVLAISKDPNLSGKIKYNILTNKIDVLGQVHWDREGNTLTDNDVNNIRLYLEQMYCLTSEKGIPRAISIIAHQNSYHPIKDVLTSLKWDGVNRIENILPKYLGAEKSEYTTEAMKLFMFGAINRIFYPGCKFDTMLCLVGGQGLGKSTLFRFMAIKDEWFSDDLKKLDDENVYRKLQGHWIIEFSEMLATANAKSIEEIKSFISRQKEIYKIPYETHPQDRQRQCIFCGTTNNMDFLPKDRTGNRRFIPVLTEALKPEAHPLEDEKETRSYLVQSWAEAMEIFKSGKYSLSLPEHLTRHLKELQKEFMVEDAKAGIIQGWLDSTEYDFVCSFMIYREALGNTYGEPKSWELRDINDIMNNSVTGWEKYQSKSQMKRFSGYGSQRAWQRTAKSVDSDFVDINQQMEIPFDKN